MQLNCIYPGRDTEEGQERRWEEEKELRRQESCSRQAICSAEGMTSYGGAIGVPVDADNIGRDVLVLA